MVKVQDMKPIKVLYVILASLPLFMLPISWFANSKMVSVNAVENEKLESTVQLAGMNFSNSNLLHSGQEYFTYEEVLALENESRQLPTYEEMVEMLQDAGFSPSQAGVVPNKYYTINWEYKGYIDPILGRMGEGEKMLLWIKDTEYNYIKVEKGSLNFTPGKTSENTKLTARFILN